jgi:hypothetical protein
VRYRIVHQKEGDEVDAGNEKQEQRNDVADDDHAQKFQRTHDRLTQRQRLTGRLQRIVTFLDHLGDVIEKKTGNQGRYRRHQKRQCERQPEAGKEPDDEGEPAGPFGRDGKKATQPGECQIGQDFLECEPCRHQNQQRQADDLPEDGTGFRRKEIGESKPRCIENHEPTRWSSAGNIVMRSRCRQVTSGRQGRAAFQRWPGRQNRGKRAEVSGKAEPWRYGAARIFTRFRAAQPLRGAAIERGT